MSRSYLGVLKNFGTGNQLRSRNAVRDPRAVSAVAVVCDVGCDITWMVSALIIVVETVVSVQTLDCGNEPVGDDCGSVSVGLLSAV